MDKSDQPARREAHPRPTIPGYQVMDVIGRGATGTVFRAVQLSLQREVAVKVLPSDLVGRAGFVERFLHEARAAGAVHHPNVLTCYDVGEAGGVVFQALELMTGGDLSYHLRTQGGRLPFKDSLQIVLECAKGLDGIHRAGLVHGDLKLSNVFVAPEGGALVIKLGDLGLARSLATEVAPWDGDAAENFATTAPEHCQELATTDIRTDIYALGAILFHLCTGSPAYPARNRAEIEDMLKRQPLPDPQALDPTLPATLTAVLHRALARDPADRYQAPAELREDLERLFFDFVPIHARLVDDNSRIPLRPATERRSSTALRRPSPAAVAALPQEPEVAEEGASPAGGRPWLIAGAVAAVLVVAAVVAAIAMAGRTPSTAPGVGAVAAPAAAPAAAPSWPRPSWAVNHGEDQHGRWADLALGTATLRFRRCPAGTFAMGSPAGEAGRRDDETVTTVTLTKPFWIADSETTQDAYQVVMGANPSIHQGGNLPVDNVSWQDCQQFTQRVNARLAGASVRLPTEAEWEYARRAGGSSDGGAWTEANALGTTHPVRGLAPNGWGLYDMAGNVLEWCQDLYAPYTGPTATDPVGWDGIKRVARGGAWSMAPVESRPAARARYLPVVQFFFLGFRLAISE